jgi:hypothetical protein
MPEVDRALIKKLPHDCFYYDLEKRSPPQLLENFASMLSRESVRAFWGLVNLERRS